jgi:uncharacterized protein (DUF58 family)
MPPFVAAAALQSDAGSAPPVGNAQPFVLDQRRVYIFPSLTGAGYTSMLAVLLIGAINYDNGLTYALTFLLGGVLLVSILHTWRNLYGLHCHGARVRPVFAGEPATFSVILSNPDGPPRHALAIESVPRRVGRRARRVANPAWVDLAAGARVEVDIVVPTRTRGRFALDRVRVATWFPLGLMRAWAYLDTGASCIVYPRPRDLLPSPPGAELGTEESAGIRSGAEDFLGFREYRPGDPARAIAWKALARGQALQVKRFAGGGSGTYWIDFEATRALRDTETRLSQLCHWVLDASRHHARFGLRLPAVEIAPDLGAEHCTRCLRALALHGLPQ